MTSLAAADFRRIPAYTFTEAAHYLRISVTRLRTWCTGRRTSGDRQGYQKIIRLDGRGKERLSFLNLVEAHLLLSLQRRQHIQLQEICRVLKWMSSKLRLSRPLLEVRFATDGARLYVERISQVIDISSDEQRAMRETIEAYLSRVERDSSGIPVKLHLFTRKQPMSDAARIVVIDPAVAFGRPVFAGTRLPTIIVADRFKAGDTLQDLADDYRITPQELEEGLRVEFARCSAA